MTERVAQALDVVETQLDAERLELEQTRKGVRCQFSGFRYQVSGIRYEGTNSDGFGGRGLRAHEPQRARQHRFHFPAVQDQIEHPVLEGELASPEPPGELLPARLLDAAGAPDAHHRR